MSRGRTAVQYSTNEANQTIEVSFYREDEPTRDSIAVYIGASPAPRSRFGTELLAWLIIFLGFVLVFFVPVWIITLFIDGTLKGWLITAAVIATIGSLFVIPSPKLTPGAKRNVFSYTITTRNSSRHHRKLYDGHIDLPPTQALKVVKDSVESNRETLASLIELADDTQRKTEKPMALYGELAQAFGAMLDACAPLAIDESKELENQAKAQILSVADGYRAVADAQAPTKLPGLDEEKDALKKTADKIGKKIANLWNSR